MTNKAPISKAVLYATLCREFKAPDCSKCQPLLPCPQGCHREYEFLTRLFSQQYRLRDLCDTIG